MGEVALTAAQKARLARLKARGIDPSPYLDAIRAERAGQRGARSSTSIGRRLEGGVGSTSAAKIAAGTYDPSLTTPGGDQYYESEQGAGGVAGTGVPVSGYGASTPYGRSSSQAPTPSRVGYPTGGQPIGPVEPSFEEYLRKIREAVPQMKELSEALGGGGGDDELGDYIDPTVRAALESLMQGGMTDVEADVGRERVTTGFGRAIGGMGAATARRGYHAPQSVAQAAMGGPAGALAGGLAGLEAERGRRRQESIATAGRIAAGMYGHKARERGQRARGEGELLGGLLPPMPQWWD